MLDALPVVDASGHVFVRSTNATLAINASSGLLLWSVLRRDPLLLGASGGGIALGCCEGLFTVHARTSRSANRSAPGGVEAVLTALSVTSGALLWERALAAPGASAAASVGPPLIRGDGSVYVAVGGSVPSLYVVDGRTGALHWTVPLGSGGAVGVADAAPVVALAADDTALTAACAGSLPAIDARGIAASAPTTASRDSSNCTVAVAALRSPPQLVTLTRSGLWALPMVNTTPAPWHAPLISAGVAGVAVGGGAVYVTYDGSLAAFAAATGAPLWVSSPPSSKSPPLGAPTLDADGLLWALDASGVVACWNAARGTQLFRAPLASLRALGAVSNATASAPPRASIVLPLQPIVSSGMVFAVSGNKLYALVLDEAAALLLIAVVSPAGAGAAVGSTVAALALLAALVFALARRRRKVGGASRKNILRSSSVDGTLKGTAAKPPRSSFGALGLQRGSSPFAAAAASGALARAPSFRWYADKPEAEAGGAALGGAAAAAAERFDSGALPRRDSMRLLGGITPATASAELGRAPSFRGSAPRSEGGGGGGGGGGSAGGSGGGGIDGVSRAAAIIVSRNSSRNMFAPTGSAPPSASRDATGDTARNLQLLARSSSRLSARDLVMTLSPLQAAAAAAAASASAAAAASPATSPSPPWVHATPRLPTRPTPRTSPSPTRTSPDAFAKYDYRFVGSQRIAVHKESAAAAAARRALEKKAAAGRWRTLKIAVAVSGATAARPESLRA